MTARDLQDSIVADLKSLFEDRRYKTADDDRAPPTIYKQYLPKKRSTDEVDKLYPYIIVRLLDGEIATPADAHSVNVFIFVGIYDSDTDRQGYRDVVEILELIQKHYAVKPNLAGARTDGAFDWELDDNGDKNYPHFYGGAQMTWEIYAPRTEWSDLT